MPSPTLHSLHHALHLLHFHGVHAGHAAALALHNIGNTVLYLGYITHGTENGNHYNGLYKDYREKGLYRDNGKENGNYYLGV